VATFPSRPEGRGVKVDVKGVLADEIDYECFIIRFFNHMKNLNIISIVFPKVLKIANNLEPEKLRNILENFNDERFIKEFEKYNQIKYKHFKRDIK
jgi:hypothetical protein